jgi:hypothetical protein
MKCCSDRLRLICFSTGGKIADKPFITKPRMPASQTDLDGFRHLMALKMSTSKTKGNDNKSLNMKLVWKTPVLLVSLMCFIILYAEPIKCHICYVEWHINMGGIM